MSQDTGLSKDFINLHHLLLKKRVRREQELIKKARSNAQKIAKMIKAKYWTKEVFLYGSLAWGGFTERSDIDLFLVGFQGKYWEMLIDTEHLARSFIVNVVCEEDASPSLRKEVFQKGVPL